MAVIKMKPTSPGQRGVVKVTRDHLHKGEPYAPLLEPQHQKSGRNNNGHITTRHKGGGHKHHYRVVDFKRNKDAIPAKVERIEYDPNRTAHIALVCYADGERRYIIAPRGLEVGATLMSGSEAPIRAGNTLPIRNIPVGSTIHCIELKPGAGAQIARSAGTSATLLAREGTYAQVRMRSGEVRKIHIECRATIGEVANEEHSLRRLGMDYIDLYQIHRFDPTTPIEETMEALHDVVKAGKARYIGASSMWAWQFSKAQYVAEQNGWTKFISMQNHYNLLNREEEREMMPLCVDQGVGVIPWSPLARGRLTRDWDNTTSRSETDEFGKGLYKPEDQVIVERVAEVAKELNAPRAQVALAWVLSKSFVTSPIVGATKEAHIDDAIAACEIQLSTEHIARLEEPYTPHESVGFL